ncbi:SLC13 family permease [Cellulomonas sp. NPDC055163]
MPAAAATGLALVVLAAVLVFAVVRPRGYPEAVAAVPGAALLVALGVVAPHDAWSRVVELGPTVAFLAGILVLADLCRAEGLFDAAGALMARASRGQPVRLLGAVVVVASLVTAVLSLDATVVLLTPVVFATAARVGVRPRPHVFATAHLANSASLLLPVSNLTNLLAVEATGLGFLEFAGLMWAPWLVAVGIDHVVARRYFAADLSVGATPLGQERPVRVPVAALVVVGLTLLGFALSSPLGVEPFWVALAGVAVLAVRRVASRPREARGEVAGWVRAANPAFLVFVPALGIVVEGAVDHGLGRALGGLVPGGTGLLSLLVIAVLSAVLANAVNNLPAVLVMLPLTLDAGPVAVLAVLIGVNVGPNLTYVGSLATLLWRRVLADHDHDAELADFTRLGLLTVPVTLVASTTALWLADLVGGG